VAFGAASILAAFSTSAEMLIVARAILGIAGATLAPSTLSLISNMFPDPKERSFAIAMWISSFSAGAIIGPLAGGLLIQYFWWGSVFLAGVPVMLLLLALGPWLLPEYRDPNAGRLDLVSAGLSLVAVLAFIFGLKRLAESGFGWTAIGTMAAGLALAVIFLQRQRRLADPLVDLRLFRMPAFSASVGINVLGMFFMFGSFIFIAQYFQLVAGLTPLEAGLWSVPSAIAFTITSTLGSTLASRVAPAKLMAGGMAISAVGFICLALSSNLISVVLSSLVFSVGFTPIVTLTTGIIVGSAPPERAGVASAISETGAELGGALGIAVLGSLSAAIYRSRMAEQVPEGLSTGATEAARATLGGAVSAAEQLNSEGAARLLEAARGAFSFSFQITAILAAVALLVATMVTLVVLRDIRSIEAH
jgi:DHA2 family multidrug resistance protein-like MFS transporter